MRMYDLIMKKRNGGVLCDDEINFMVNGYTAGKIPDYQMSAMTMAIYFQGMNEEETLALTMAMAKSGDMLDLSAMRFTLSRNCCSDIAVENPEKLSSLSIVPPVCPSPLPLIFATVTPAAATIGVSASEVLSPTPPVECLSTFTPWMSLKSSMSPLFAIAIVSASVSSSFIP